MTSDTTSLEIYMFPCLADNYGFLLHDSKQDLTATIDTPDVDAIEKALVIKGWKLTHILNTHHHWDHAGGNLELKKKTGCLVAGPLAEASKIPGIDIELQEGDIFQFGQFKASVYDTPGHTSGHIVYHFKSEHAAFVGDTLFAMGCGRLFEGTPEQMWHSLQKIMQWPDETRLYCAHEYTLDNAKFAITIDPANQNLINRLNEVERTRSKGLPTIPTTLELEKKTNPFLRAMDNAIRYRIKLAQASNVEVFAKIRQLKDNF